MKLVNKIKKKDCFSLESELTFGHNETYEKKNDYNINKL